jgi:hypothetical protein
VLNIGPFHKISTLTHRGNICCPEGQKKLFLIIVSVLGHPKGVWRLKSNYFHGGMDVFWNDTFFSI